MTRPMPFSIQMPTMASTQATSRNFRLRLTGRMSKTIAVVVWTITALSITELLDPTVALLDSFAITLGGLRVSALLAGARVLVFPSQVEDVIAGTPGTVKEAWQIYVDTIDGSPKSMTVAIECDTVYPGNPSSLADSVARSLASRLGLKVPVECHPRGTLPRYEAKARRVLVKEQP